MVHIATTRTQKITSGSISWDLTIYILYTYIHTYIYIYIYIYIYTYIYIYIYMCVCVCVCVCVYVCFSWMYVYPEYLCTASSYGSIFGKRALLAIDHIMLALFWSYVPNMK